MRILTSVKVLGHDYNVFSLFTHLRNRIEPEFSYLLESIESRNRPLYSFLCFDPDYILQIKDANARVTKIRTERGERLLSALKSQEPAAAGNSPVEDRVQNPIISLDALSEKLPAHASDRPELFSRQVFYGGYLGLIAYDVVGPWVGFKSSVDAPQILLGMHTQLLIYDHRYRTLLEVRNRVDGRKDDEFLDFKRVLEGYSINRTKNDGIATTPEEFETNTSAAEFREMVEKSKRHIFDGDIYQVVLSRKVNCEYDADDTRLYAALRELNPSPYMYYLDFDSCRYVGSSPELLVSLDGREITTVPIAGTRRRGRTIDDEMAMKRELTTDPKERAEHVMLVDLARNDIAKLAEPGTLQTIGFMTVKKFRHVMHMVTKVSGTLREGYNVIDVLKSVFPAGTVAGAPKLRAMEIIHELEKESRGSYGGAIGYMALNGDMDWAITIRTLELQRNRAYVQAGAGIVADSKPGLEWLETENKMRSLLKALSMAELKGPA